MVQNTSNFLKLWVLTARFGVGVVFDCQYGCDVGIGSNMSPNLVDLCYFLRFSWGERVSVNTLTLILKLWSRKIWHKMSNDKRLRFAK